MIRTGKKFSKPEMSRVINGDTVISSEEEKPEKIRLDILMTEIFKSYNRSTIQKFIEYGFVTVDGVLIKKANAKFERGVKIDLKIPKVMKNADLVPDIIYEDDDVIVLNKPAGLLSMSRNQQYSPESTLEEYGFLVHRLDRNTSGVVIVAKTPEVQEFLKKQFQARTTKKTYFAVVSGRPKLDEARVDLPLARDLKHKTTFRVDPNGKEAETFYKVIKANDKYALIELHPTTGRTHQLRVHLNYLGHPILGDEVYGGKKAERLFLHANKLEITLPNGGRRVFEAKLPTEFLDVFR